MHDTSVGGLGGPHDGAQNTVDDTNPALPRIRNMPIIPIV